MINRKNIAIAVICAVALASVGLYWWNNYTTIDAKKYGQNCRVEKVCGFLVGIDCQSSLDGPYYYINRKTEEIISTCGGACRNDQCAHCPPKEWGCDVY